jgi:proliferating cell nuclear antigen
MFEARLVQGKVFKQLIEALKDLVQDVNVDCTEDEMSIQAMDSSHVSLVAATLRATGFDLYRCDRPISLGFNSANMAKILKCAGNDDIITLKAEDTADTLTLMFEGSKQDRIADFGTYIPSCYHPSHSFHVSSSSVHGALDRISLARQKYSLKHD